MKPEEEKSREEGLISKLSSSCLEAAFRSYYRMRNVCIGIGLLNLLATCFLHLNPTAKKVSLYSSLIFQIMLLWLAYYVCVLVRNMESQTDLFRTRRKTVFSLKCLNIGGICWYVYNMAMILVIFYSGFNTAEAKRTHMYFEVFSVYAYTSGMDSWLFLLAMNQTILRLWNASNNKTQTNSEAGHVARTYDKAEDDVKDSPV